MDELSVKATNRERAARLIQEAFVIGQLIWKQKRLRPTTLRVLKGQVDEARRLLSSQRSAFNPVLVQLEHAQSGIRVAANAQRANNKEALFTNVEESSRNLKTALGMLKRIRVA